MKPFNSQQKALGAALIAVLVVSSNLGYRGRESVVVAAQSAGEREEGLGSGASNPPAGYTRIQRIDGRGPIDRPTPAPAASAAATPQRAPVVRIKSREMITGLNVPGEDGRVQYKIHFVETTYTDGEKRISVLKADDFKKNDRGEFCYEENCGVSELGTLRNLNGISDLQQASASILYTLLQDNDLVSRAQRIQQVATVRHERRREVREIDIKSCANQKGKGRIECEIRLLADIRSTPITCPESSVAADEIARRTSIKHNVIKPDADTFVRDLAANFRTATLEMVKKSDGSTAVSLANAVRAELKASHSLLNKCGISLTNEFEAYLEGLEKAVAVAEKARNEREKFKDITTQLDSALRNYQTACSPMNMNMGLNIPGGNLMLNGSNPLMMNTMGPMNSLNGFNMNMGPSLTSLFSGSSFNGFDQRTAMLERTYQACDSARYAAAQHLETVLVHSNNLRQDLTSGDSATLLHELQQNGGFSALETQAFLRPMMELGNLSQTIQQAALNKFQQTSMTHQQLMMRVNQMANMNMQMPFYNRNMPFGMNNNMLMMNNGLIGANLNPLNSGWGNQAWMNPGYNFNNRPLLATTPFSNSLMYQQPRFGQAPFAQVGIGASIGGNFNFAGPRYYNW